MQLDAGIDEKIMLVSRDEQSCLIVSYREVRFLPSSSLVLVDVNCRLMLSCVCAAQIKNCIESAFADLSRSTS